MNPATLKKIADNGEDKKLKNNDTRYLSALKHLFCGGVAGSVAKTVTAPLSRLTILFQVHSLVTTKEKRPKFSMTFSGGLKKIVERGGLISLWKGNGTSVLHRFPFSAINFFVYENMLEVMTTLEQSRGKENNKYSNKFEKSEPSKLARFISGASAGSVACIACYPLDLVRTRLTTELPGKEHYKGITDAFQKILNTEGFVGLYSGLRPTLFVAVPNFAISYTVYGTLKEYVLDDELFYNLRRIDDKSGEEKLGLNLTLLCGAASGSLATLITFPFDTIRRRMQIQNLHIEPSKRMSATEQILNLYRNEGGKGLYRGLTPELVKVVPMVGTMFLVYEFLKEHLEVDRQKR